MTTKARHHLLTGFLAVGLFLAGILVGAGGFFLYELAHRFLTAETQYNAPQARRYADRLRLFLPESARELSIHVVQSGPDPYGHFRFQLTPEAYRQWLETLSREHNQTPDPAQFEFPAQQANGEPLEWWDCKPPADGVLSFGLVRVWYDEAKQTVYCEAFSL